MKTSIQKSAEPLFFIYYKRALHVLFQFRDSLQNILTMDGSYVWHILVSNKGNTDLDIFDKSQMVDGMRTKKKY